MAASGRLQPITKCTNRPFPVSRALSNRRRDGPGAPPVTIQVPVVKASEPQEIICHDDTTEKILGK